MYTRETSFPVILLGLALLLCSCVKADAVPNPLISYLNGTWMKVPGSPSFYGINSFSWGKGKTLGESGLEVDLGDFSVGEKGWIFYPGGGVWPIVDLVPIDTSTIKVIVKHLHSDPGTGLVEQIFHFLDRNRFWIETSIPDWYPSGPNQIMYRLSGPGDPPPPPPKPRDYEE